MKHYYVNSQPDPEGNYEVHALDCNWNTSVKKVIVLGSFDSAVEALREATKQFDHVKGCIYCCPDSY